MTYQEAMELRLREIQRQPVDPEQLRIAKQVIAATRSQQQAERQQEAAK